MAGRGRSTVCLSCVWMVLLASLGIYVLCLLGGEEGVLG